MTQQPPPPSQSTPPSAYPPASWVGFRVPSQDTHGHSERVNFRAQPGIVRMAGQVVSGKMWPYRDMGDLMRHALDRHMKWLETLAPIPSVTKQVDAIMEVLREDEFNEDFRHMFVKMQQRVSSYVGMGSEREAKRLVASVVQYVADMPGGDWRDRYLAEIERSFGHIYRLADNLKVGTDPDKYPPVANSTPTVMPLPAPRVPSSLKVGQWTILDDDTGDGEDEPDNDPTRN